VARPALLEGLIKIRTATTSMPWRCASVRPHDDQDWMRDNAGKIKASREKLGEDLEKMKFRLWPSQANFILARPPVGDARFLYYELRDRGILVRYWDRPGLDDKIRITVGTEEQNLALLEALKGSLVTSGSDQRPVKEKRIGNMFPSSFFLVSVP